MENIPFEKRKEAIEEEISLAFSGDSREGGVSLSEAREIDNYGGEKARREARKSDTDTRWEDVPDESIRENFDHFAFLDEIGFHYYIPAYMFWCVRELDESELGYEDSLYPMVHHTTLRALDISPDQANSRLKHFTHEQLVAIAHFLQFLQKEQIEAAERWWKEGREEWRKIQEQANLSETEIDALEEEEKRHYLNRYGVDEDVERALKRFWGQFLQLL